MTDQRFRAEKGIWATGPNTVFESNVYVNGTTFFIGEDLIIGGNLVYSNTSIAGDLIPTIGEAFLGNNTNRFALFTTTINVNTAITPTSNGVSLGGATARFDTYTTNVNSSGTLTVSGNVAVNTNAFIIDSSNKKASVNGAIGSDTFTVYGTIGLTGNANITGSANVSGNVNTTLVDFGNSFIIANTTVVTNTSPNVVDAWSISSGRCAKLVIFVDGYALATPVVHAIEMLIVHDGINVLTTKYAELYNTSLGSFDAAISAGEVRLSFTASAANTYYVKTTRTNFN